MLYQRERDRFHELDALRGLAAIIVVLTHYHDLLLPKSARNLLPHYQLAAVYLAAPLYSGQSAVILFFTLSGFVLSLPFLAGKQQPYPIFALRRVARIYLPYLVALGVAVYGDFLFHGQIEPGVWARVPWADPPSAASVWQHVYFLGNYDPFTYNMVFWSLVIEMRVSLFFPFLLRALERLTLGTERVLILVAVGLTTMLALRVPGSATVTTIHYACCFLCGIHLARARTQTTAFYSSLSTWMQLALAAVSFSCFGYCIALRAAPPVADTIALIGAMGVITLSMQPSRWKTFLRGTVPQFLGQISFSMYLVHVPVLFACSALLRHSASPPIILLVYLPCVLFASTAFFYAVEAPCLVLSRRIGAIRRGLVSQETVNFR